MLYLEVYKIVCTVSVSEPKNLLTDLFMEKSCLIVLLHYVCWSFITFLCQFMRDCQHQSSEQFQLFQHSSTSYNDAEPDYTLNSFIAWLFELAVKYWFQKRLTGLKRVKFCMQFRDFSE
jgi:hypothetical protein